MNANDLFHSACEAVMALDLECIKMKLMHAGSGEGWHREKAAAVEKEYRRFLCLMKLYPDDDMAPLVDVDTFWHYHILDTMKYAQDCEQAFGYFVHHYPYVGLRGEGDEQVRIDGGERMQALYETTFGEPYPHLRAHTAHDAAYCAGPGIDTAYCAGPGARTAYCAGPGVKAAGARSSEDPAYCADPGARPAYFAGPGSKIAYCAGPGSRIAYCAGPGVAAAYCAGPGTGKNPNAAPIATGRAANLCN